MLKRNRSYALTERVFPPLASGVVASAALFLVAACAPDAATSLWSVTDSAGIALLSGPAPSASYATLGPEPLLEFSEVDGSPLFRASAVLPRRDGSFVVADAGNHRLLLLDSNGTLQASFGAEGDGPGEFQILAAAALLGDSVLVYDQRHRRVTVLGPELELVRDQSVMGADNIPVRFVGTFGDGRWVGSVGQALTGPPPQGVLRQAIQYFAMDDDRRVEVGTGLGSERWVRTEMSGGQITSVNVLAYPFFRNTVIAVRDQQMVFGDTDSWRLWLHDGQGNAVRRIQVARDSEPFGQDGISRYVETLTDLDPAERRATAEALQSVDLPESLPAFSEIQLDDLGNVWVRAFHLDSNEPQEWFVVGETGAEGRLVMPVGFALMAIDNGRLYGVFKDAFDVESVRVYELL